ncbi:MAG: FMN-binding protein [Algibacter sp.]
MNIKQVSILFLAFITMSFTIHKDFSKKIDKEIKEGFNVETYVYTKIQFTAEVNKALASDFEHSTFVSLKTDDILIGYAYISKAPSKTDNFDYLVLLDTDLIVVKSKVLVYREDYGAEIGSKRWLKQFIGKTQNDTLKYGDNIMAISGATISVRSMTNAMNNLLKSLKIIHSKNIL